MVLGSACCGCWCKLVIDVFEAFLDVQLPGAMCVQVIIGGWLAFVDLV